MISEQTPSGACVAWEEQQNPGVRAHCRRVAAWAMEIASSMGLPSSDKQLLEQVCLLHHLPPPLLHDGSRSRLLQDVAPEVFGQASIASPERILGLLDVYRNESRFSRLFDIFETANMFDEQLEMLPFETDTLDEMMHAQPWEANPAVLTVLPQMRKVAPEQFAKLVKQLPVFPAVASEAIRILRNPNADLGEVSALTRRDQVLAGELIAVANSAAYSSRFPVATVTDAIGRLGTATAQRVLTAAAIRPVISRSGFEELWQHSLESAAAAEQVARVAGMDPEEGFLAGLMHDVGRLLFSQLPEDIRRMRERLIRYGCQATVIEQLITGMDHAAAGGEVLKHWSFPEKFVIGVHHHHQPERSESPLASLLYMTEFWTASEEDIASNVRLRIAERRLGISIEELQRSSGVLS